MPRGHATDSIPNSMGMSLPKGSWVTSDTSAPSGGTRIGRLPPSQHVLSARGSGSQGFCGTDWEWRLLILIGSRANHDEEVTPEDRKGAGAAAPPFSRSPGMAQAASNNSKHRGSCHKPTGYRRLPGGNVAPQAVIIGCDVSPAMTGRGRIVACGDTMGTRQYHLGNTITNLTTQDEQITPRCQRPLITPRSTLSFRAGRPK